MRIGINTLFLVPGDVGGTEVYLRNTLVGMAAAIGKDILVVFTNRENDAQMRRDLSGYSQVEFRRMPCPAAIRPVRIVLEQFLLPLAVKLYSVDVLWSPGYTAPAVCGVPQAVTLHDLQYKSHPEDMGFLERLVLDVLVRTACLSCEAVITISQFSKKEILRHGFAQEEKVYAIPEGVAEYFAEDAIETGAEKRDRLLALGVRLPYLLCVAHTYPHKNVDKLVAAFTEFAERFPHQLVLVGKARRGEEKVRQNRAKMVDPERVIRLSGLSLGTLRLLYQEADVFILPSSYEGFGLPVLEAMMARVPVIVSRLASLPELGGECVSYVKTPSRENLLEAMEQVMALGEEQLLHQREKARERARGFTWERTAELTLQVLRDIAAH